MSELNPYPANTTFHTLIARNKRNTVLLVIAMGLLIVAVAAGMAVGIMSYGGSVSVEGVLIAVAAAVVVTLLSTTWSYFGGAKTILRISGAREIEKRDDPQLFNIVEELAIAGGLPMPKVYLIDSPALNAFATGRDPEHAAVAITRGLREKLNREELSGVMAHEMAHVRHYDIRLTMMMATMVGLIVLACDVFLRSAFYSGRGRRYGGSRKGGGGGAIVLIIIALVLAIIAPLLARMMQLAVSRQREYLADAGAVELTRNPHGLIGALRKLAGDHTPLETANRATAHLYIDNPFLQARDAEEWDSVFSTHPPMSKRIERLAALLR